MAELPDFSIKSLGEPQILSSLAASNAVHQPYLVDDNQHILYDDRMSSTASAAVLVNTPSLELAGPRRHIYFEPLSARNFGIVTCGGLCPGMNDVIRGLVMESYYRYGVHQIFGFRNGYRGCVGRYEQDMMASIQNVSAKFTEKGGTVLGTSRSGRASEDCRESRPFWESTLSSVIGGDGTMRGGLAIAEEIDGVDSISAWSAFQKRLTTTSNSLTRALGSRRRTRKLSRQSTRGSQRSPRRQANGVGIAKLMGRHSGFIACYASLATSHVNFTLIPEVPFNLDGERGFLGVHA